MDGQIGQNGTYDLEFVAGKLQVKVGVSFGVVEGALSVGVDAIKVIDAIERAIPGQLDDVVLELLKKALGA